MSLRIPVSVESPEVFAVQILCRIQQRDIQTLERATQEGNRIPVDATMAYYSATAIFPL
jgi:hypothetical protein